MSTNSWIRIFGDSMRYQPYLSFSFFNHQDIKLYKLQKIFEICVRTFVNFAPGRSAKTPGKICRAKVAKMCNSKSATKWKSKRASMRRKSFAGVLLLTFFCLWRFQLYCFFLFPKLVNFILLLYFCFSLILHRIVFSYILLRTFN